MRKSIKLIGIALGICAVFSFSQKANAQKFAYINSAEAIALMPERDSAMVKLQKFQAELQETGESMEKDFNAKLKEYQDKRDNWAPAVVADKEKELSELQQRIENFYNQARQDIAQRQETLLTPIMEKARNAINKVAKAQGITYVFEVSAIVYLDESSAINLLADVKKELGIPASKTQPMQFN